ncbi:MAG: rhomboid family intramembrane serine protease [Candidatus Brocadiales bacterium]|nr:rhomboid family intramembrane serine protease [Candidatus Brocadiales bacterium]
MKITYKNTRYKLQLGLGQGLTRGAAILGGVSILTFIITQSNRELFYPILGFGPSYALGKLMVWQFLTANFLHGNLVHLSFNMLGLYMFGGPIEKVFKEKEFIKYFLICGMGGFVLTYLLWLAGIMQNALFIGASAAIYGLLLAFSLLYPKQKVLLFFAIPMQAKWLAIIFGGLEFLLCFRSDGINHIGHLGGVLAGLVYFVCVRR